MRPIATPPSVEPNPSTTISCRTCGRTGRCRRARPHSRRPPSAGCRRRRAAPVSRARMRVACRHSSHTSRRSGEHREGTAMRRTCAATPSSRGRPMTPPSPPAPRSNGTTAWTRSRHRWIPAEPLGHHHTGDRDLALAADHRLRITACARRVDQHERVQWPGLASADGRVPLLIPPRQPTAANRHRCGRCRPRSRPTPSRPALAGNPHVGHRVPTPRPVGSG